MSVLSISSLFVPLDTSPAPDAPPKPDWPLMSDVSTIRAGVPEALVHWRRAKGEALPKPNDPY